MARQGVRIPPGLTIPTTVCQEFYKKMALPDGLMDDVFSALEQTVEPAAGGGRRFGCKENPLLLSVRSGAALSLPGMMDTVLDLGLNDEIVEGLAKKTNPRFAYDWCVFFCRGASAILILPPPPAPSGAQAQLGEAHTESPNICGGSMAQRERQLRSHCEPARR
jgi:phosphoenolpyruvate synthase/pyruvate phosphate dikinase